ncbi:MAG: SAM-dependent DNA methyltransferase [Kiritimatiellae bacterium]|nr:SAM-dependent DNA methyltransferase [Kiritimatiellia bacterium]
MAIKKNELYGSLWASCDKLRGGMDASQYKDYILTLLFVKYVSDKFKDEPYADITVPEGGSFDDLVKLCDSKNIGEDMDKVVARLAEENDLRGVIDNAKFNDETKIGKGEEMVDKLTGLINIFRRPELDFSQNRADGDDLIGDAYEFLMRKFATESGKSKGQFYTPAEVSRILAKVIGIADETDNNATVYDPACGSGSLLIRALDEVAFPLAGYGQEKDVTTAGLAKMNTVLHNRSTTTIKSGNTFSFPQYFEDGSDNTVLKRFDYIVANPPFSTKNWTDGLKEYGRFDAYSARPPEKNGDYAWLLHILKSLKSTGKAAVILPHGVLFRGNAEETIRREIVDKGYIKAIISLPSNLFYGTGIPACIIVLDKETASKRDGILMIDASRGFMKDGDKNRLREQDIYKIVKVFNDGIRLKCEYENAPDYDSRFARYVPMREICEANGYNLNIPRYIDGKPPEDIHDIEAHLKGGIPAADIDALSVYWLVFGRLRETLFSIARPGYLKLNVAEEEIQNTVYSDSEFRGYAAHIDSSFNEWKGLVDARLRSISVGVSPKELIASIAKFLFETFTKIKLIDRYDVYQVLLSYWRDVMADDVYVITADGYEAARELECEYVVRKGVATDKLKSWEGKLIPKRIVVEAFFASEAKAIEQAEAVLEGKESRLAEIIENAPDDAAIREIAGDDGKVGKRDLVAKIAEIEQSIDSPEIRNANALLDLCASKAGKKLLQKFMEEHPELLGAKNDKGNITVTSVRQFIASLRKSTPPAEIYREDYDILIAYEKLSAEIEEQDELVSNLKSELDKTVRERYQVLTVDEIKELLVNRKWYFSIFDGIDSLYTAISHRLTDRIKELSARYADTLPELQAKLRASESEASEHLKGMGFSW